jgi:hypothetical protein
MVFLLLVSFLMVLVSDRRFAFAFFISAEAFAMVGTAAAGADDPVSLRFVTLDESPLVAVQAGPQTRSSNGTFELTTAGYRAKSVSIQAHQNDLAELHEHIKYELRRGNITAEKATTLNHLIDEIEIEAAGGVPCGQVERTLIELTQTQAKLSEMLADTTNLVEALGSVRLPEFAGTFIAAKIQAVRLQAEKAGVDGSIDEIRKSMKRPKAG